jgi:hypothetical protein
VSVTGDFAKLDRLRKRIAKAPAMAPIVAKKAAAGRANFTAEGGSVRITVAGTSGPPRKRKNPFWNHGFKLALGFMPPQWMRAIKMATDKAFEELTGQA